MPSTPRSYAKCVKNLMQTSTNSQQKQMKQEKILSPAFAKRNLSQQLSVVEGIQKNVSKLKSNPSNSNREFMHRLAHAAGKFRRSLGYSWKYRKPQTTGNGMSGKTRDLVKEFWYEVLRELPLKKFVKKCELTCMLETSYIQAIQEIQTRAEGGVCRELHKVEATK